MQDQWFSDPDFIPSRPLDLAVLRQKFEDAVRRHLLAEVLTGMGVGLQLAFS
jgi:hypothetical protein